MVISLFEDMHGGKGKKGAVNCLGKKEGILLVMHWYKHPAFKYPLTHRCGRTETIGRNSLLKLLCQSGERTFLPNLHMEASGIGEVLKVLISRCENLKVILVLPSSLNVPLHLESALCPHELMYCHTEWG